MEDQNSNNSNSSETSSQSSPIQSKRGQYNPNLTQKQNVNSASTEPQASTQYIPNSSATGQNQYEQQMQNTYQYAAQQPQKLKHSGVGISSFVLALVAVITGIICIVLVTVGTYTLLEDNSANLDQLTDSAAVTEMITSGELGSGMTSLLIGSLLMFLSIGLAFIGVILGIIAVVQKNRKKVFSVLGLVFNGVIVFGFIILMLLGFASSL